MSHGMRGRAAAADLAAIDLLRHAVRRLLREPTSERVSSGDFAQTLSAAYPDAGRMHDDHLLVVMALSGQAANLLMMVAQQSGMDPLMLMDRLRKQTEADAVALMAEEEDSGPRP